MFPATRLVDGISAAGLQNGVVRVAFTRLLANGQHYGVLIRADWRGDRHAA